MKQNVTIVPMRKYIQINIKSGRSEVVRVSNRNHLTPEYHQKLLNLNDTEHEYIYLEECADNLFENNP